MKESETDITKLRPGDIGHSFWDDIIDRVVASGKPTLAEFLTVESKKADDNVSKNKQ